MTSLKNGDFKYMDGDTSKKNYTGQMSFLPKSLVKLVQKIAKIFEISSYDEFSLLDTLEFALNRNMEKHEEIDERKMTLLLINIIRLTEKYNKASSQLTKVKIESVFKEIGISSDEFNQGEFETFKLMDFHIVNPISVEIIFNFVEINLRELKAKKEFLFEFSVDILRLVYFWRTQIYNMSVGYFIILLFYSHLFSF